MQSACMARHSITDLSTPADTTSEPTEWHTLLVSNHILQVGNSTAKVHVLDGLGCLTGVLQCTRPCKTPTSTADDYSLSTVNFLTFSHQEYLNTAKVATDPK